METRFGHDFSSVRVHAGTEAAERARSVEARAYTFGQDIAFGADQFSTVTTQGRHLLAHELTHTVQQRAGGDAALQRAPARPDSQDVNAARTRADRLAQRIRMHTRLSREVRASINGDLAFFGGAAKDAYVQIIRPVLQSVTELQMPAQSMRHELPPVHPVASLYITADELCGGTCYTDDEIDTPRKALEQQEEGEREQLRARERDKLRSLTKDWGDDQAFAAELLESVIRLRANVDPRAVSDRIREPILERYRRWLKAMDAQRLAACVADKPGLVATIRGRFNNDDPCKSWFADEYSHGPSELLDLERQLRIHSPSREDNFSLSPADVISFDLFDYRKKTDPGLREQEQMAGAMVGAGVALVGGINETVNQPAPTRPVPQAPSLKPKPFSVVQGGGQSTSSPKGQLSIVDTEGNIRPVTPRKNPPTTQPPASPSTGTGIQWDKPAVKDTQPPLRATGSDPVRPRSEPPSQAQAPKAVRRIVNPDSPGTTIAPPERGTSTPASIEETTASPDHTAGVRDEPVPEGTHKTTTTLKPKTASLEDSEVLRANMRKAGREVPDGHDAHHLVATKDGGPWGDLARKRLTRWININDADNGIALPGSNRPRGSVVETEGGPYHATIHTDSYYKEVAERLKDVHSETEARQVMHGIMADILNGDFPHGDLPD